METKTYITLSRLAALLLFLSCGFWLPAQTGYYTYGTSASPFRMTGIDLAEPDAVPGRSQALTYNVPSFLLNLIYINFPIIKSI